MNDIYPIGSIYMNVLSANHSTIFGGTWQKIEGRFLLASSSSYEVESITGQSGTKENMPVHIAVNVWERTGQDVY